MYLYCPTRKKSLTGMKRKHQDKEGEDSEVEDPGLQDGQEAAVESDDEVEYYRQAVGQEPDEGEDESQQSPRSCQWIVGNQTPFFFFFFPVQTCFPVPRGGKARPLVEQRGKTEPADLQHGGSRGRTAARDGRSPETETNPSTRE